MPSPRSAPSSWELWNFPDTAEKKMSKRVFYCSRRSFNISDIFPVNTRAHASSFPLPCHLLPVPTSPPQRHPHYMVALQLCEAVEAEACQAPCIISATAVYAIVAVLGFKERPHTALFSSNADLPSTVLAQDHFYSDSSCIHRTPCNH